MAVTCKICGGASEEFDVAEVLGKYQVRYYRCPDCGFIQTEESYWLEESYSDAITDSDIGLVGRNYSLAGLVGAILKGACGNKTLSHLDFGGGGTAYLFV